MSLASCAEQKKLDDQAEQVIFIWVRDLKELLCGAVVAMRMCVVMHCAMRVWWGCTLGALSLRFVCDVPLVLLRDCFCVALQMLSVVHLMAIAAPDH